jgi:hypothetical protein
MAATEEVAEHVHEAHEPYDKLVAGTMAIIAALLAVVSVLGQHFNTEKVVNQQLASDQWAYYQAKDIRRYVAQVAGDDLLELKAPPAILQKYKQDTNKYKSQSDSIQEKAREFERERDKAGAQAERFHFGEVFLEVAIVFSSLAILIRRKPLFVAGVISAIIGIVISITGYWA